MYVSNLQIKVCFCCMFIRKMFFSLYVVMDNILFCLLILVQYQCSNNHQFKMLNQLKFQNHAEESWFAFVILLICTFFCYWLSWLMSFHSSIFKTILGISSPIYFSSFVASFVFGYLEFSSLSSIFFFFFIFSPFPHFPWYLETS